MIQKRRHLKKKGMETLMKENDKNTEILKNYLEYARMNGAALYLNGKELKDKENLDQLMENSSYMLDVEGNDNGQIIRINFQDIEQE